MPEWSKFIEIKQNIWKALNEDERIFLICFQNDLLQFQR